MRKILRRIQTLGQQADQLKAVAAALPGQAARLRETILMSGAQLRQLRADVQSSVTALRTDSEDRVTQALGELNDSAPIFLEAGYELDGVDLELGPAQRLIVHLEKCAEVDPRRVRALVQAHNDKYTTRAVLSACLKADEMAGQVQLSHLDFCELVVHAGSVPVVRLCWRAPAEIVETDATGPRGAATPPTAPPPLPASGRFGQQPFFEARGPSRPAETPATTTPAPAASGPVSPGAAASTTAGASAAAAANASAKTTSGATGAAAAPGTATSAVPGSNWRTSALDRFKQMPDLSRPRSY